MTPMKIGVIGCGNISDTYLKACKKFGNLVVAGCADMDVQRAREKATQHELPFGGSVDELLADKSIELIVNITIPKAHAEIDLRVLNAGKHVFSEKPFALTRDEGRRVLELAHSKNLRVGCAPDTVLGAAVQTCRKLLDEGAIGTPVAGTGFMMSGGPEHWHPSPEFVYEVGGGPMFDMGPYYLHALITLLGPVKRVCGVARISYPERTITSQPKFGKVMKVEVPTHISAVLEFASGPVCTLTTSFDIKGPHNAPTLEIYGSEGSMMVPDPNGTGGTVKLSKREPREWKEIPHSHKYKEASRGVGVADMAQAIRSGRQHRANADIAFHTLDIMQAIHEASASGRYVELTTTCERPQAMRADLPEYTLDE